MNTTLWNVPYQRNLCFTGREQLLIQLQTLLLDRKNTLPQQPLALSGLGGIGKTQTVVEYAHRYRDHYKAVFWLRADTRDTLTSDYLSITALAKVSESQDQIQRIAGVKHWLETHNRWLLIFDNADDLKLVSEFLPSATGGHILLTTRANTLGHTARKIEIEKLEPAEGALFLLRRTGILAPHAALTSADAADIVRAEEISRSMDGLPLALDQAGAYIEERHYSLSTYLTLYKKSRNDLLKERGGIHPDHPESVAATLFLSFRNVEQVSSSAADLLRLCAFLAPDAIPEEVLLEPDGWLEADLDTMKDELEEAMSILQRYSLIQQTSSHEERPTFSLHRLVQVVLRDAMDEATQRRWIERIANMLNRMFLFDYKNVATWSRCERLLPHALVCMDYCKQWEMYGFDFLVMCKSVLAYLHHFVRDIEAEALAQQIYDIDRSLAAPDGSDDALLSSDLNNHALILEALNRYTKAEALFQQALQIRERIFGRNHAASADIIHNLANLNATQGFFDKAEQLHWEALSIRLDAENVEKEDVADSNHNLGNIYSLKDYGQAEKYYQQSLAVIEKENGPNDPKLAVGLQNLGLLYDSKGQYSKAEASFLRALAIHEGADPDHPNVAKTLICLANFHKRRDRLDEAGPLYERALAIYQKAVDPEHPDRVIVLISLASFYQYQKQYDKAEPLYEQAKAIREKIMGPDHPNVAKILVSLALLYTSQQKYEQANALFQRALTIREKTFGRSHPDVADTLYYLALLSERRDDYQKAESFYSRALRIFEKTYGRDHPDVARSLTALVDLYNIKGYYRQAVPYLERILTIYEKTLDPTHEDIITTLVKLAQMYDAQGMEDTAIKYLKRSIALHKKSSEANELDVLPYLERLASIYINKHMYPKAEELYKQALMINERALVPDEQLMIQARLHLAQCFIEQEKYPSAEQHYKIALQRSEALSGPRHIDTLGILHDLAVVYNRQEKYKEAKTSLQRLLKAYEIMYGPKHMQVANTNRFLGHMYYELNEYAEAATCFQCTLSLYEQDTEHDTLDIAHILLILAEVYRLLGQDEKALPLLQRKLKLRKAALKSNHPDVAASLAMLADLYNRQGQAEEAFPLYREALHIRETDPSSSNTDLFQVLIKLAGLYLDQEGQETYQQAESLYRRALQLFNTGITCEPLAAAYFFTHLADCCILLEKYADGASFYQRAWEICQQMSEHDTVLYPWIEQRLEKFRSYMRS